CRWSMPPTARRGTRRSRRAPVLTGTRWFAAAEVLAEQRRELLQCLRPAGVHAGEHLRRRRMQALGLRRHGELGAPALLLERHLGDALEIFGAVEALGKSLEHQPLGLA